VAGILVEVVIRAGEAVLLGVGARVTGTGA
jgi:hypothetical protein